MSKTEFTYSSEKRKPGKAKAFFICLAIASFLWIVHSLNKIYTHTLTVPVEFSNVPTNKQVQIPLPNVLKVDVKVSGLRLALILLQQPFKSLKVDFATLQPTNRNRHYVLSGSRLNFKSVFKFETQVKHISPDTLYFSDKIGLQKTVAVKVPLYLACEEGFGYRNITVRPQFITIWGDTAVVKKIDTAYTAALNLTHLNKSYSTRLDLLKPSDGVYFGSQEVNFSVEVEQLIQQSVVLPLKDINTNQQDRIMMFPSRVKVVFTALQNGYSLADSTQFSAVIDSKHVDQSTQKCRVLLQAVPPHVTVLNIEPAEVEIMRFRKQ